MSTGGELLFYTLRNDRLSPVIKRLKEGSGLETAILVRQCKHIPVVEQELITLVVKGFDLREKM